MVIRVFTEQLCAVWPPHGEERPTEVAEPSTDPNDGPVASGDDGTLQWQLLPTRCRVVPGFVSEEVDAHAKGVQSQDRQLVMVEPTGFYDIEAGAALALFRRTHWWYP